MGAIAEAWRGSVTLARWFGGLPLANVRLLAAEKSPADGRALIAERARRILSASGIEVNVDGEPPAPGQGCVVAYNECSFADVIGFQSVMWTYLDRTSAADVFAMIPFTRAACRKIGIALIPRGNREGVERVMTEMVDAIRAGQRVAWGGEGRLSGRDEVLRFKVGASLLAIRAQAPLVPVAFRGGHSVLPLGSIRARPGVIRVRFGAPLSTRGLVEDDARGLADSAHEAVAKLFAEMGSP